MKKINVIELFRLCIHNYTSVLDLFSCYFIQTLSFKIHLLVISRPIYLNKWPETINFLVIGRQLITLILEWETSDRLMQCPRPFITDIFASCEIEPFNLTRGKYVRNKWSSQPLCLFRYCALQGIIYTNI